MKTKTKFSLLHIFQFRLLSPVFHDIRFQHRRIKEFVARSASWLICGMWAWSLARGFRFFFGGGFVRMLAKVAVIKLMSTLAKHFGPISNLLIIYNPDILWFFNQFLEFSFRVLLILTEQAWNQSNQLFFFIELVVLSVHHPFNLILNPSTMLRPNNFVPANFIINLIDKTW